jgi:very-short-patch-repair endonuclease
MIIDRTYQNKPALKNIRRFLRSEANSAEQILWRYIRKNQLGYKFRRQFSIGNFVADFYCHELKLVIELDGWTHEFDKAKVTDKNKQQFLESKGYRVFRLANEELFEDPEIFLERITSICHAIPGSETPPLAPPLVGEGEA